MIRIGPSWVDTGQPPTASFFAPQSIRVLPTAATSGSATLSKVYCSEPGTRGAAAELHSARQPVPAYDVDRSVPSAYCGWKYWKCSGQCWKSITGPG